MLKKITLSSSLILSLFIDSALSISPLKAGEITITGHRWIRPSTGPNTAAYLTITSQQDDKLIKVDCKEADIVELHNHINDNGVMRMRPVEFISVGKDPVSLKPGSLHIMLMGLKDSFRDKSVIPLTLHFEKAGPVTLDFDIKVPETKDKETAN